MNKDYFTLETWFSEANTGIVVWEIPLSNLPKGMTPEQFTEECKMGNITPHQFADNEYFEHTDSYLDKIGYSNIELCDWESDLEDDVDPNAYGKTNE
jgi:hypothetical protein